MDEESKAEVGPTLRFNHPVDRDLQARARCGASILLGAAPPSGQGCRRRAQEPLLPAYPRSLIPPTSASFSLSHRPKYTMSDTEQTQVPRLKGDKFKVVIVGESRSWRGAERGQSEKLISS